MNEKQRNELILQSLTHEKGGVLVYETALKCVQNEDLRGEWEKYLEQTRRHVQVMTEVCSALGIDPEAPSPGRPILQKLGAALVAAMEEALHAGPPEAAEIVACECVVLAETKDHLDWHLLTKCAEKATGEAKKVLQAAVDEVEDEEDEHVYHSKGWCRELWIQSLGMKAVLPPPEEEKHVKTAIGAARAEQAADGKRH
jgi:rubrerythrin